MTTVTKPSFQKTPPRGMRDFLPTEVAQRQEVLERLQTIYRFYGYQAIETPAVEWAGNLNASQGGDNEKLVFKILKRGDKFTKAWRQLTEENDIITSAEEAKNVLSDLGLRYDLTLPLARYIANNQASLAFPCKTLQTGYVWRAERPQKNRFRQFRQCDLDILGEPTAVAEIELLTAALDFLSPYPLTNLTLRLNDRRLVIAFLDYCGFPPEKQTAVLISGDKKDKIGLSGVIQELQEQSNEPQAVKRYQEVLNTWDTLATNEERQNYLATLFPTTAIQEVLANLGAIREGVAALASSTTCSVTYDISLIRGMSYYTGPIYELYCDESSGSAVAGGGRYDQLLGQFLGRDIPACGLSIGFERLLTILLNSTKKEKAAESSPFMAWIYDRKLDATAFVALEKEAQKWRQENNKPLTLLRAKKNKKEQARSLEAQGYQVVFVKPDPTER